MNWHFFIWILCLIWPWTASIARSTIFYILLRKWLSYHLIIFILYTYSKSSFRLLTYRDSLTYHTAFLCSRWGKCKQNKCGMVFLKFSSSVQLFQTNFQLFSINILPAIKGTRNVAFLQCLLLSLGFSSMLPIPILQVSMLGFFDCTRR